jgi:hypothetical protein
LTRIDDVNIPIVGLSFFTVVFDTEDPERVASFGATVLERELIESGPELTDLSGEPRDRPHEGVRGKELPGAFDSRPPPLRKRASNSGVPAPGGRRAVGSVDVAS